MDPVTPFSLSHSGLWVRGWAHREVGDCGCDGWTTVFSHSHGGSCCHGPIRSSVLGLWGFLYPVSVSPPSSWA